MQKGVMLAGCRGGICTVNVAYSTIQPELIHTLAKSAECILGRQRRHNIHARYMSVAIQGKHDLKPREWRSLEKTLSRECKR